MAITASLHEDVDDVAVLVHRSPEVLSLTPDRHEQFIQVPGVTHSTPSAAKRPSVVGPERLTPLPNRLVGDRDTPLSEQVLNIAETQAEPVAQADSSPPANDDWVVSLAENGGAVRI